MAWVHSEVATTIVFNKHDKLCDCINNFSAFVFGGPQNNNYLILLTPSKDDRSGAEISYITESVDTISHSESVSLKSVEYLIETNFNFHHLYPFYNARENLPSFLEARQIATKAGE